MAERAFERYAWAILVAVGIFFVLVGAADVAVGTASNPTIVEAIAGMTPEEIGEADPAILSLLNLQVRVGGAAILVAGLLVTAIAATTYRRGGRWAWYALWTVPLWNVLIFLIMYMGLPPEPGVLPPPLLSTPVLLTVAVVGLLLPIRRFFPKEGGTKEV